MSKPARSSEGRRLAARLAAVGVVGAAAIALAVYARSPLSLSEARVRRMIEARELNGLPVADAAARLQQRAPAVTDGAVLIDFSNIRGWSAGSVVLDVRGGVVTAASWGDGQGE